MGYEHFTMTTSHIAYFKVRDVPIDQRVAYIDSTFVDWERYWKTMANTGQRFCIVMNISDLKQSHKSSREHMVMRLKQLNEEFPGTWVATAIVASSMLTRGIATAYSWFAPMFPGVEFKAFGNDEEATAWLQGLLDAGPDKLRSR